MKKTDSEKLIERKLVEAVKNKGGLCIKMLSDYFTGLPDRLCLFPGKKVIFVELKTTGQKPRKIQTFVHNKLKAMGFQVSIVDTVEGINSLIENIDNADNK